MGGREEQDPDKNSEAEQYGVRGLPYSYKVDAWEDKGEILYHDVYGRRQSVMRRTLIFLGGCLRR